MPIRDHHRPTGLPASEADLSNMNNSDPILPPTPLHDMAGQWWETEELAPAMRDYLLNIFCLHRASIHFTFHEPTFKARLAAPEEAERPHRALLESIYLLACYFSARLPNNQSLVHHEEHFLKRARQALMESLSYSDRLMDFLMGSILLTQYLYMRGRWLEGYHVHCGAARFALSCGLHQLPSHIYYSPLYNKPVTANVVLLPAPTSGIELGERISTFWMLYMCDKLSSIAAGFVCALPTETDAVDAVETVFPRAMEEYEVNDVNEFETCNLRFLFDPTSASAAEGARQGTPWTVTIKGFAILERAVKLSTVHRARPTGDSAIALRCLELAANRVLSTLPPIAHYAQESTSTENMTKDDMAAYIAHNTVLGALMEIHQALDELDDKAHYALLSCAKRTADLTACVKEEGLAQAYLIAVGVSGGLDIRRQIILIVIFSRSSVGALQLE
ncbi:hypothetical protein FRB90_011880 [Tulasnella sp. 427]|nr:hypothetical protein FRB90_011880 [Tulasnella sp. 427]